MGRTKRESTAATLALSGRLGDLVDQWKYDNKKTQEELAKEIGVRASSLSDWINDSSTPTIDQLYKGYSNLRNIRSDSKNSNCKKLFWRSY